MKIKFITQLILIMLLTIKISAQSSFGLTGNWGPFQKNRTLLNGFESNPSNFSLLQDWGLSISYGGEFANSIASNLYLISLAKSIGKHNFSVRYTPGYQKEFIFENPVSIILDSSTTQSLNSKYTYRELLGAAYSYKFNSTLSAGFTLRYFNQEFNQEEINSIITSDTVYLERKNNPEKLNFWKADFGINYFLSDNFSLSISSINLLNLNDNSVSEKFKAFTLKNNKAALLSISYQPYSSLELNLFYETNNSLQTGINLLIGDFGFSVSAFHDKDQTPFIAGIIPAVSFSNKLFGITLSGVKYFSNRDAIGSFTDFSENGLNSILNNRFSFDKAVLTLTFRLNTLSESRVKFLNVDIIKNIYTSLGENYLNQMFAVGNVVNLTDGLIEVKPSSRIEGINADKIQSPPVKIGPKDTSEVKFYSFIPDNYSNKENQIAYVDFYLLSDKYVKSDDESDDKIQKAVLVNGINAWNGKVSDLNYFIKRDQSFSVVYSKNILSSHKAELDTIPRMLSNFGKAKIIFNEIVKKLVYVSDPRATADYVQYPKETIDLKGGDCDDLSVLYSSLLESIGIQTALIDFKPEIGERHVSVSFNTELSPLDAALITNNDSKYFVRKNEKSEDQIWINIETTSLSNFNTAWDLGSEKFNKEAINNLGLAKNKVKIIDIQ